jgi:hypothetical protein
MGLRAQGQNSRSDHQDYAFRHEFNANTGMLIG